MNGERLPWHRDPWQRVAAWLASGRIPHAVLLAGRAGLGKGLFAEALAQALLCPAVAPDGSACLRCRSCQLFASGTHPDLLRVEPLEPGKPIKIEAIRDLVTAMGLRSALGRRRVALLTPADAMNRNAANALLKTLEEPPGDAVLLLVTHAPARLPATVRSRCQQLAFHAPPQAEAREWLAARLGAVATPAIDPAALLDLAGGAPLAALTAADGQGLAYYDRMSAQVRDILEGRADPIEVAKGWEAYGLGQVCRWSYRMAGDLARARVTAEGWSPRAASAASGGWASGREGIRPLFRVVDRALETLRVLDQGIALNEQIGLDELALTWGEVGVALRQVGPGSAGT
jgi:DNA polymerase-3 subunit delta'